jgi:hypothetical protein
VASAADRPQRHDRIIKSGIQRTTMIAKKLFLGGDSLFAIACGCFQDYGIAQDLYGWNPSGDPGRQCHVIDAVEARRAPAPQPGEIKGALTSRVSLR